MNACVGAAATRVHANLQSHSWRWKLPYQHRRQLFDFQEITANAVQDTLSVARGDHITKCKSLRL